MGAGLGYAPIASGTFGTLAGIPFFYYLSSFSWPLQLLTLSALLFLSFWAADEAGKIYGEDIVKPPPANWFDKEMKNGVGVTLDDLIAGLYAALALRLCLAIFS